MITRFKHVKERVLKRSNCLKRDVFEKRKSFYSIKIIDSIAKKDVKVFEGSERRRGKKDVETRNRNDNSNVGEDDTEVKETGGEKNLVCRQSDLFRVTSSKSIFYESERIVKCESGKGGDGTMSFKKFRRKVLGALGIPNGGKGGDGGSVYLCYTKGIEYKNKRGKNNDKRNKIKCMYINNLSELPCALSATNGGKGKANQLRGEKGTDIFVYLNKMCHVYKLSSSAPSGSRNDIAVCSDNRRVEGNGTNRPQLRCYKSTYEEKVYNVLKREDPIYVKRNNHILKEIKCMDEKVQNETYMGFLSEKNNCMLISKGGEGGKGNNMQNTYSYEEGKKGVVNYVRIVYKCISDICFIGYNQSGKSTLLSLITHKIHTVNNVYILKKIFFKDNFQISVAEFFSSNDKLNEKKNTQQVSPFHISFQNGTVHCGCFCEGEYAPGREKLTSFPSLRITVTSIPLLKPHSLSFHASFCRAELKRCDGSIHRKPYVVVINKCDVNFGENVKKAEEAYNKIRKFASLDQFGEDVVNVLHNGNVPVFFVSAKYAMGITEFVNCLRRYVQKLKHKTS
ncbi:GTP-binding protein, putative [Plasmodium ovale wallikeri]|uniref:GTP-binding protein, putative n=1 Tax=Plasmodium ovale wallikeri TaxID=864142 RepID=A0A1A8Z6Z8_PLAOA|nr:GTP-binding protein, putative [Plasmodium ovale wallikeri]SBT39625.1 GTP-binding protein, putative [Plasmodium ovale wallikeri]